MKITIQAQHTTLTPAINDYINKRMEGIGKFVPGYDENTALHVQLGKTSTHHHAGDDLFSTEVQLDAGKLHLRAEATDADLYASIDKVRDEIVHKVTSEKKKRTTLFRKGSQKIKNMMKGFYKSDQDIEA